MRISLHKKNSGNVLFATLFTTGIICLFMGSYLSLVRNENSTTRRSQTWNMAIPVAEAGIEEALAQIQTTFPEVKATTGWENRNGNEYIYKKRELNANEYYQVCIFAPKTTKNSSDTPVIVSEGFVRVPSTSKFISRTVRVNTKINNYSLPGMVVMKDAEMNGNKIYIDSYNSTNAAASTDGRYDVTKRRDKGLLATLSSSGSIDVGNASVWGKVGTPASSSEAVLINAKNGTVGSTAWHKAGKFGIENGYHVRDLNVSVQTPKLPDDFSGGLTPIAVNGVLVLGSGDYVFETLSGNVIIAGNARVHVKKSFNASGLTISNALGTAKLELYVSAADVDISKGTQNSGLNVHGRPSNFKYIGLPSNRNLKIGGNANMSAFIYAPSTDLTLAGGGSGVQDLSGAALVKNLKMGGHYNFHYDESGDSGPAGFLTISWDEIKTGVDSIFSNQYTSAQLQ